MAEVPHLNGLNPPASLPVVHSITVSQLRKILAKKNARSSPGSSGVRYMHLALILEAAPEFLCDLINEQLNSTHAPDKWSTCTVIPVYKVMKMLQINDPKALRMIVLQDALFKLVGCAWQELRREYIVSQMGDLNHA
jgi:hypothetical protein